MLLFLSSMGNGFHCVKLILHVMLWEVRILGSGLSAFRTPAQRSTELRDRRSAPLVADTSRKSTADRAQLAPVDHSFPAFPQPAKARP